MLALFMLSLLVTFPVILLMTRTKPAEKRTQERIQILSMLHERDPSAPSSTHRTSMPKVGEKNLLASLVYRFEDRLRRFRFVQNIERMLAYSGSKNTLNKFLLTSVATGIGAVTLALSLSPALPMAPIALVVGSFAPYGALRRRCGKRLKKFNDLLSDAIDLMARALRAGHSMASAIEVVAQQSPEPLGPEFAKCAQQQRFGIPFRNVLLALAERVPSSDLHFLVTAIMVQKETGGDLTEILDRTTEVIRERVRIHGEIRTHTSQGRLTGWILSGLPVALLGVLSVISPTYSRVLFNDPMGQKLLYAAGILIAIGAMVIRKIVDIKV